MMKYAKTPQEVTYDLMREIGLTTVYGNPGVVEPNLRNAFDEFGYAVGS